MITPRRAGSQWPAGAPEKCAVLGLSPETGFEWVSVARQAPLSTGFSRQEYWSGLPFPSPGDLPDPGIEPGSPAFQEDALTSEPPGKHSRAIINNQKKE